MGIGHANNIIKLMMNETNTVSTELSKLYHTTTDTYKMNGKKIRIRSVWNQHKFFQCSNVCDAAGDSQRAQGRLHVYIAVTLRVEKKEIVTAMNGYWTNENAKCPLKERKHLFTQFYHLRIIQYTVIFH